MDLEGNFDDRPHHVGGTPHRVVKRTKAALPGELFLLSEHTFDASELIPSVHIMQATARLARPMVTVLLDGGPMSRKSTASAAPRPLKSRRGGRVPRMAPGGAD